MEEEKKEEEEEVKVDPLEFAPTVDVLEKFSPEWLDETAAIKKWDEKKVNLKK